MWRVNANRVAGDAAYERTVNTVSCKRESRMRDINLKFDNLTLFSRCGLPVGLAELRLPNIVEDVDHRNFGDCGLSDGVYVRELVADFTSAYYCPKFTSSCT